MKAASAMTSTPTSAASAASAASSGSNLAALESLGRASKRFLHNFQLKHDNLKLENGPTVCLNSFEKCCETALDVGVLFPGDDERTQGRD